MSMACSSPKVTGKHHTPFCQSNCELSHHDLVTALFTDGRYAASRIHCFGELPEVVKQAVDSAKLAGWDPNCFIPDPLEKLRYPLLFLASAFGKSAIVEGLLRNNFNARVVNQHGETALHFAAKHFHLNKTNASFNRKAEFENILRILTEHDPKILAAKDKDGRTALHISASGFLLSLPRKGPKKTKFYQFCLKSMVKRVVELEDAAIFTKKEVMDIIKAAENNSGDSFLHILARSSSNFEVLKYVQDLLFGGRLPQETNKQGKTILSILWDTEPSRAGRLFSLSPDKSKEIKQHGEKKNQAESTQVCVENTRSCAVMESNSDHSRDCEELMESVTKGASQHLDPEFDPTDKHPMYVESDTEQDIPCIDKVFSLFSEGSVVHGGEFEFSKNPEDARAAMKRQVFSSSKAGNARLSGHTKKSVGDITPNSQSMQMGEECGAKENKCSSYNKLNHSTSFNEVDCQEPNVKAFPSKSGSQPEKVSDAYSSFLDFVICEGEDLEPEAKKSIVEVVMTQYFEKLSQVEVRLPKLEHLMKEEEQAIYQQKELINNLEEELLLLKRGILAKEKGLEELQYQCEMLNEEEKMLKRKVSHCLEMQEQLIKDVNFKKLRSE